MKRMIAFIVILLFALLYMTSYLPGIYNGPYGKTINIAGQAGLGAGILLFFIFRGTKKTSSKRNNH